MKLSAILSAAVLTLGLTAGSAMAQQVVIMNGTGFTIAQLGLADSNSDKDAEDLLGDDTLKNGEGLQINIQGSSKGWELIAVDNEGTQVNWQDLDLTGVSKITLHADGTANME